MDRVFTPKQKALQVNLNSKIYGTFAEIGAGQEVVRYFFRSGGASGTIAKAMSAYDKQFSDAIYGKETSGRYVCESRLGKMLSHEYGLIEERLSREDHPNKTFFAFADTVTTINFQKTNQGHGWLGLRFQLDPNQSTNDVIFHVKLHENDVKLQHETIGIIGVNLIYGCFFLHHDPKKLLLSLYDNLSRDRIEIDMIHMSGPDFMDVDNRLLSLQLVKNKMTDAVIFGPDEENLHPADVLYKKNILVIRGSFRPVTKVNIDMIRNGYKAFSKDPEVEKDKIQVLFEITLSNLLAHGDIDEKDFVDRANILCSLGQTVLISNYQRYHRLVRYFSDFTKKKMGVIIGVNNFQEIFQPKYYDHLNGGIYEGFGIMYTRDLIFYLYPGLSKEKGKLVTSINMVVPEESKILYDKLMDENRIFDLEDYDPKVLNVWSREVLKMIRKGESGWEEMVPKYVDLMIKDKKLFGYKGD